MEAVKWLRLAAKQENPRALGTLGKMYATGSGVLQDDREAARYYRLAAEKGDTDAQASLGFAYLLGQGVAKDIPQAYFWAEVAGEKAGNAAKIIKKNAAPAMTAAQIADAKRRAGDWKPQ